jgi:hypothetical protein
VGTFKPTYRGYYMLVNDPRFKHVYYEEKDKSATTSTEKVAVVGDLNIHGDTSTHENGQFLSTYKL